MASFDKDAAMRADAARDLPFDSFGRYTRSQGGREFGARRRRERGLFRNHGNQRRQTRPDPYATDAGPRTTSMRSEIPGARNETLGPARRPKRTGYRRGAEAFDRVPVRREWPGTAVCPSATPPTPGTFSSACSTFAGARRPMSSDDTSVVAVPGGASTLGAAPEMTTASSMAGSICINNAEVSPRALNPDWSRQTSTRQNHEQFKRERRVGRPFESAVLIGGSPVPPVR